MRNVYTIIFAGCISFAGFTAHAQSFGISNDYDSLISAIEAGGGTLSGSAIASVAQEIRSEVLDASSSAGPQVSAIQGTLVVDHAEPAVNQTVIEIIDTRTGRNTPKLKINFAEFPLRSLTEASRPNNGSNGRVTQTGTPTELVVQRIQRRLSTPPFNLAIEDRTATISGTVATADERKLIELMLRFEPGISTVKNEMTVAP